ncbi:MAG: hypothetical protein ABIN45_01930, partial [Gammaproteobacteria bacterium]
MIAIKDIYNTSRTLLVRQGARIDFTSARRLAQHRSIKPVEHHLQIEGSLTSASLKQRLQEFLAQHDDLAATQRNLRADDDLALLFEEPLSPILLQKLTVMSLQQPTLLEQ